MEISDWGIIAEIVSAIGIIVTLIYLAIQVHQNTRQEEFQGLQAAILRFLNNVDSITRTEEDAEIFRKGVNYFEDLPSAEQGSFHSKMHSLLHGFHSIWILYKSGILPEYELVAMRRIYVELLMSPGGGQWWKSFKHIPPPHLVAYLDEEVEKARGTINPANQAYPWLRGDEVES
jgi:hypothetical protein